MTIRVIQKISSVNYGHTGNTKNKYLFYDHTDIQNIQNINYDTETMGRRNTSGFDRFVVLCGISFALRSWCPPYISDT